MSEAAPQYLSVEDIASRWSCSERFVYYALAEMRAQGYLRRLRVGRGRRVALESVARWEREHQEEERDVSRSQVVRLRAANDSPAPRPLPSKHPTAAELRALCASAL